MKTLGNLGSCLAAGYVGPVSGLGVLHLAFIGGFEIFVAAPSADPWHGSVVFSLRFSQKDRASACEAPPTC